MRSCSLNSFRLLHHEQIVSSFRSESYHTLHVNKAFFLSGKSANLRITEIFRGRQVGPAICGFGLRPTAYSSSITSSSFAAAFLSCYHNIQRPSRFLKRPTDRNLLTWVIIYYKVATLVYIEQVLH